MPNINIGYHDRGMWDGRDDLYAKDKPIKSGLTAKEAEALVKTNPGSELVIKQKDGKYSVYNLSTSETDKKITNQDFKDKNVKLTSDVAAVFGGTKAYVSTDDNVIRSFEIEGIQLNSIEQDFVTANLTLNLSDKDGIETGSKKDMEGTISGNILIKRELIEFSLAQANKNEYGVKCNLTAKPSSQEYVVDISYDNMLKLGKVTLKMEQGCIKAKIEAAGVVGNTAKYGAKIASFDIEKFATDFVKNILAKNSGLAVTGVADNEIKLEPDFRNNNLLNNIPVGDMNYKIESAKADPAKTRFIINRDDSLKIELNGTKVIASSNPSGQEMKTVDKEGPDTVNTTLKASLNNDLSVKVEANASLKVNITPDEAPALKTQIKKITGQDIGVSGSVEINDVNVKTEISPKGQINYLSSIPGKIKVNDLNLDLGNAQISLKTAKGNMEVEQQGKKIILKSENLAVNGSIKSGTSLIDIKDLQMNQDLVFDSANPGKLDFTGGPNSKVKLSADITDTNAKTKITIKDLNINGTKGSLDTAKGDLSLGNKSGNAVITMASIQLPGFTMKDLSFTGKMDFNMNTSQGLIQGDQLKLSGKIGDNIDIKNLKAQNTSIKFDLNKGDISLDSSQNSITANAINIGVTKLKNAAIRGKLDMNTNTGKVTLEGKSISLNGNINNIEIKNLKGSGVLNYDPNTGIRIERTKFNGSAVIAGIDISKIKGSGDIIFDKEGNLVVTDASDVDFAMANGLKAKGDLKISYKNNAYTFSTGSEKPMNLSYESSASKDFKIKDALIEGSVSYNEKTSKFSFNSNENTLKIKQGNIGGMEFKDFNLQGELEIGNNVLNISNSKGPLAVSGKIGNLEVKELKSEGPIKIDIANKFLSWDKEVSIDLPSEKLKFSTSGDMLLNFDQNGRSVLTSKGGALTGSFGDVKFENFKFEGKILYDPKTKNLIFEGLDNSDLKISGKLNGKELNITTTGAVNFAETENELKFSGENIKVDGTLDGFNLQSLSAASGEFAFTKDTGKLDVSKFKFDFAVDGIEISNKDGSFKPTADGGYALKLSGNIITDENELIQFMKKFSSNSLTPEATKKSINDVISNVNGFISNAQLTNASYKDLTINLDKDFNFKSFSTTANGTIENSNLKIDMGGKDKHHIMNMPMKKIDVTAHAESASKEFTIKDGSISFQLTTELREAIKKDVTKKLEEIGMRDVDLNVLPNGQVKINSATYEVFSSPLDKLGRAIGKLHIPVISDVVSRALRITDISVDLKVSAKLEDKKFVVSIDEASINQVLAFVVTKVTDAAKITKMNDTVAQTAAGQLKEKDIKGNVLSIDLQKTIGQINKDIVLNDLTISDQGMVEIKFSKK